MIFSKRGFNNLIGANSNKQEKWIIYFLTGKN
jgi:hypothetical protein